MDLSTIKEDQIILVDKDTAIRYKVVEEKIDLIALKQEKELLETELAMKEPTKEELIQLASLPGKDQMIATLLATFNAPVSAFVRVVNAIKESKESGAEPTENAEVTAE